MLQEAEDAQIQGQILGNNRRRLAHRDRYAAGSVPNITKQSARNYSRFMHGERIHLESVPALAMQQFLCILWVFGILHQLLSMECSG